jgi:dihydrofolate reductase
LTAGKVIYSVAASIDGFIASPDGSFDWLLPYPPDADFTDSFLSHIGGVLMGRVCLELELGMGGEVYPDKRVAVMTHRAVEPQPANVACFAGDMRPALDWLSDDRRDIWLFGGGDVAGQALAADVIDELHLAIVPVTLGKGRPLFDKVGFAVEQWELLEGRASPAGYFMLTYQKRRNYI